MKPTCTHHHLSVEYQLRCDRRPYLHNPDHAWLCNDVILITNSEASAFMSSMLRILVMRRSMRCTYNDCKSACVLRTRNQWTRRIHMQLQCIERTPQASRSARMSSRSATWGTGEVVCCDPVTLAAGLVACPRHLEVDLNLAFVLPRACTAFSGVSTAADLSPFLNPSTWRPRVDTAPDTTLKQMPCSATSVNELCVLSGPPRGLVQQACKRTQVTVTLSSTAGKIQERCSGQHQARLSQ